MVRGGLVVELLVAGAPVSSESKGGGGERRKRGMFGGAGVMVVGFR